MTGAPTPDRYLVGGPPSAVIIPGHIAERLDRELLGPYRRRHRENIQPEALAVLEAISLAGLQWAEHREATSQTGSLEVPGAADLPRSDHDLDYDLDCAAVAVRLGVTRRQVVNLAEKLGGIKRHGRWTFDPVAIDHAVADRANN